MKTTAYSLKSLADLKRAIKNANTLEMVWHVSPEIQWNSPSGKPPIGEIREIVKRQTNCIGVRMLRRDGTETTSHLYMDSAKSFAFDGSDTFSAIDTSGMAWAQYRIA